MRPQQQTVVTSHLISWQSSGKLLSFVVYRPINHCKLFTTCKRQASHQWCLNVTGVRSGVIRGCWLLVWLSLSSHSDVNDQWSVFIVVVCRCLPRLRMLPSLRWMPATWQWWWHQTVSAVNRTILTSYLRTRAKRWRLCAFLLSTWTPASWMDFSESLSAHDLISSLHLFDIC